MSRTEPPIAILRTLPSLYADPANVGYQGLMRSIRECERDEAAGFYIALAQQPKYEVLHLYLLIGGEVNYRFMLAGYSPGTDAVCWDQTVMQPKLWAICTGPVERPPHSIKRRGFQGFRYVYEPLW